MVKKIRLQGLSFKEELMGQKIDFDKSIIYLSLIPFETCNYKCIYCHQGGDNRNAELIIKEMSCLIREAPQLGIRSLILLGGEVLLPSVWNTTRTIVQEAYDNGLITLIFTNGSELNYEKAQFLAERNVSVALKIDSLVERKYDEITRQPGSFKKSIKSIEILKNTSIGEVVYENEKEKLVRLLFSTVGCELNYNEYISLARFATNHQARWMMELLNYRGNAIGHSELIIPLEEHSDALRLAIYLNPEQAHDFHLPCRMLSCISIHKNGEIGICPQDYDFLGNIRNVGSLSEAYKIVESKVQSNKWRNTWTGKCPIKKEGIPCH